MKTVTIQIGNSDDKLSQQSWADYVSDVHRFLYGQTIHFSGGSESDKPWQNYCWVIECDDFYVSIMEGGLNKLRTFHKQDSIAFTVGDTKFI